MSDHDTPEMIYEIDISHEHTTNHLQEIRGVVLQQQMYQLAQDFRDDGYDLRRLYRYGPGTVSLIIYAPDPEDLRRFAHAALESYGYELPDIDERLGQSPEEADYLRNEAVAAVADKDVHLTLNTSLALRLANNISGLLRGNLISSGSRNDLKVLASELQEKAFRNHQRPTNGPVSYESWALATAADLAGHLGADLRAAERLLLENLAPHHEPGEPDSYLNGYPEYVVGLTPGAIGSATRDLLWCLYHNAWNTESAEAPQLFCTDDPDSGIHVIGLMGYPERRLAFYDQPDLTSLSCATPEDLRDLHRSLSDKVSSA